MTWTKPLKITQMVLASIVLLMSCYGAVVFMVHVGYAFSWFSFAWTMMFSVLRVYNRRHDTKNWRRISIGLDVSSGVFWLLATALLAKDSAWLAEGKSRHGSLNESDPRLDYVYTGYGLAALYVTYAAAAVAGIVFITFVATGWDSVRRWNTPLKGYDKKDKKVIDYNPLQQYDVPNHWIGDGQNVREV